jgi:hypothetical protein
MFCYEVLRLQNLTIFEVEFFSNRQLGAAGATQPYQVLIDRYC